MTQRHFVAVLIVACSAFPAFAQQSPRDLTGSWDSDSGWVTLEATAKKGSNEWTVTGHWIQSSTQKGTFTSGTFNPATRAMNLTLAQPWNNQKGTASFTLSADGKQFDGTWKHSAGSGKWHMTRVDGSTLAQQIGSILENAGIKSNQPGVAILVVQDGKVVVEQCTGIANLAANRPITSHSTFDLASCSKLITAHAVMLAHDRGMLAFDDDVRKYIPELPVYDKNHPILIKNLLDHTSGLPYYMSFSYPMGKDKRFVCLEDYAKAFADQQVKFPAIFAAGEKYEYSNSNYMMLALVVQRVSKKRFGTFLKDELFTPLAMTDAFVYEHPDAVPQSPPLGYTGAVPYYPDKKQGYLPFRKMPPASNEYLLTCGDGYIFCSLKDMEKWDVGWRRGGLVKPETLRAASAPVKTRDGKTATHGYSVDAKSHLASISHEGWNGGTSTSYSYDAETGRTIVVLCNRGDFRDRSVIYSPLDHLITARTYKEK